MTAVILAAGKGSRIASLTNQLPKSFLTLGCKRVVDHQIQALRDLGIKPIVMVIGYRSELFEEGYGDKDVVLVKNPFFDRTNVLASLWFARDYLENGFFFMHADTYFEPGILHDLAKESGGTILAVNRKPAVPEDMKVRVNQGLIVEITKEMPCELAYGEFIGLAKIDCSIASTVVDHIRYRIEKQGRHDDFFETVIQDLIDEGEAVQNFDIGNRVAIEIDYPEDYEFAKQLYHRRFADPKDTGFK